MPTGQVRPPWAERRKRGIAVSLILRSRACAASRRMSGLMVRDAALRLLTMRVQPRRVGKGAQAPCPPRSRYRGGHASLCPPYAAHHEGPGLQHASAFSRRDFARVVAAITSPRKEGAGYAGRQPHPQPCVRRQEAHKQSHHRFSTVSPAFPARVVLTACFALSPETWLFCLRRRRDAKHRRQT